MRLTILALLLACDGVKNPHALVDCDSPTLPSNAQCEIACAEELPKDTAMSCTGSHPDIEGGANCNAVETFDGIRGCCRLNDDESALVFAECD